ncbi:MAG: hypothetical protein WBF13_08130 [Candidatus Zixiibacteriota bacterium]
MKRTVLVLVLFGLSWLVASSGADAQVAGDANGDSIVNVGDVVYEVSYLYKNGPPPVFYECGDPTADCIINVGDIVYLVSYLFKNGPDPQIVECGWSEPVNLGPPINSDRGDYDISFSLDWRRLVLGSDRYGTHGHDDVWFSFRDDTTQPWPDPVNCGTNINTVNEDLNPCISPDGNKIYYAAWNRPGGYGGWDIWVSTWDSLLSEWSIPENAGPNVNHYGTDWSPFITHDGGRLYFSSNRYFWGISYCEWEGTGWGELVWLGWDVNINGTEEDPSATADGSTLYFTRWLNDALPHIFVSYWTGTEWGVPVELPPHINYPGAGAGRHWITPEGTKLYFASGARPGGMGYADIWVSERIPVLPGRRFINRDRERQR